MKKLMVMMGAVATALGLFAEAGTVAPYSFEADASDPGVSLENDTFTPGSDQGWTWAGDPLSLGAYAGDAYVYPSEGPMARRNDSWTTQNKFLKLETGKEVLGLGLKENVFVDQLVKFTGFEEYPTEFAAGTKIAVWMSAIETDDTVEPTIPGETNLYVSVGTGSGTTKVKADVTVQPEKWYRLTIKSLGNVIGDGSATAVGFIIYLDGEPLKFVDNYYAAPGSLSPAAADYYTSKTLFMSMDKTSDKVASVGYQGIGGIDDLVIDRVGPDFAGEVEININSLALNGAKVIKIGDVTITDQTSLKVRPGDILVSYAANGPYIVKNGEGVKWTVAADGALVMDTAAKIQIIEAAAKITRGGVDTYYAADELDATIAQVQDGDIIDFLKDCTALEEKYVFAKGTRVTVTAKGNWDVEVPADKSITDLLGTLPEKNITITFETPESENSSFFLAGNIYGNGDSLTKITANGYTMLSGNLTIGATYPGIDGGQSAELKADYIVGIVGGGDLAGDYTITLIGSAKVITKSELTANSFGLASASDLKVELDAGTGYYTYSLNATEPTTGFMVILAGQTQGVYETLAAAVEAAQNGSTIKLLANGTATAKVDVTKNITLDLNGKTLARDNNAATLFVIKDATLTINGATAGSALVGRLNVGDSVYNGGERTAHWDGKLVINGGTYSVGNGQTVIHVNGDCQDAAVTINNATLTSPTDNGVQFNGKGTFAINNSTINGATAVYMKAGTLTIDKDSKINATAETWTAPVANHNGSNPTGDAIVMDSTTGYQGAISLTVADGAQVTKVAEGAATIRETITDATESTTVKIDAPTIGGIALTEAFLAKVANGSAQLPGYVATIGTVPYQTLAAAFAAATAGDTVTVLADCTVADTILVDKAVTLDATGKTVTCAAMYPFFVKGGDLTITDGTFTQNVVDGIILWAKDGGKITVNGGDFSAIPDGEIAYVSTADALIKIYGGKFVMANKADGSKGDVLNVAQTLGLNKTDYIQVYGGSFSKDPAEGDDALGPTFVADGYASVKQDNGLWKVGAAIIATFKVDDAIVKAETNIVAFTPVAPTNPSKEGYTFTGWTPAVDEISKSTVFVAQFKAEETKVDPEQPIPVPAEKTPEQVAEQMNTKGIANYLKVPTVVTDAAAYTAMFAAKADGNTVIIALKPTVEAEIKAELANTATSGSMLNPDATTSEVTITARPGLFYGIKAVGDVTTIGTANGQNWVQASGDTVNVVRPTVSGNAAFFQAVCSPKAPPANN